ncbi:MAG: adenylate/guanylate cyclase domain-containing protein [Burkholderiaceae bacterium]|nr:adenylate/guanylate cyclase domain-containing protein [Burkholderiaceae bacterium]
MTDDHGTDLIEQQIAQGQFFLAYDTYRMARDAGANTLRTTLLGSLALLRSGAVEEARRVLLPLWPRLESRSLRRERVAAAFREAVHHTLRADHVRHAPNLNQAMDQWLTELERTQHAEADRDGAESPEVLRLVSEVQLEIWLRLRNPSDLSQALRAAQQVADLTGELPDQLQAARLAALNHDPARARQLATAVARQLAQLSPLGVGDSSPAHFQRMADQIEVAVLLEQPGDLTQPLQLAASMRPRHLPSVVALLRKMDMLDRAGLALAAQVRDAIRPPSLVVFAGQALDAPDAQSACFPPGLEPEVAKSIAAQLDAIGAEVGFCSASSGSELLFVEAMLDRGAEVHLFLPFSEADFIRHRVAFAGGRWERRFHSACKLATSITYATEEAFLGHDALLRFNNHLIQGMARAQAQLQLTQPHLVVVWDYAADSGAGSAADFMDNWPDIGSLHLIDLDELRPQSPLLEPTTAAELAAAAARATRPLVPPLLPLRHIRTLLFADIVGYSKLKEQDLPLLWRCLEGVKSHLTASGAELRLIESWGDAIYAVMDNSLDMATYALTLIDAVAAIGTANGQLSQPLQVRIGLHTGPVFEGVHPLTGRPIVYGSHVSRAARIEPVALPGHAYASQQFVAMLLAEESAQAHKAQMTGQNHHRRFDCEYLGMLSLAKNYGRQQVYHLRKAT